MKFLVPISVVCLMLAFAACGGDSATSETGSDSSTAKSTTDKAAEGGASNAKLTEVTGTQTPPQVQVPPGPPPTKLVVKDLKEGSGAVVAPGKTLRTQFVGVNYKTGKVFEVDWGKSGPFAFTFGSGEAIDGWETGLKGMKVGGRRELILPSKLAYNTGTLLYVVELLSVK